MRLPKNRLIRFALYVISIAIILIAVDLVLIRVYARVHPGPDTTVLTAPILPDGRVDYVAALDAPYAAGVTRENNAAAPFIQAFGPHRVLPQRYRTAVSTALGLTPTADDARFIDFDDYFKAQHTGDNASPSDIDVLSEHPWRAADHPDAAAWLDRNAPYLDLLHQASLRPYYYYPYNAGPRPDVLLALLLPDVTFARQAINAFLTRAMLRAESGDADGAIGDLLTAYRFVTLFNQSPISVVHSVANYADVAVSKATRSLATRFNGPQLRALSGDLDALPPLAPVVPTLDREERFLHLDALQYLSRQSPRQAVWSLSTFAFPPAQVDEWTLVLRYCFPVDYDAQMRALNGLFDRLAAALNEPTYPARHAAVARVMASVDSLPFLLRTAPFLSDANLGRIIKKVDVLDLATTQRLLTRVAVSLALYKSDTGHYPASFADLIPKYLPNVPTDPYTLKPLSYHPTATGYTLTSAGPNMADDDGRGDDLVVSAP